MSEKDRYAYYETAKRLGREEGHADAVANVIRTMSSKGMSPSEIADLLNLSEAEVCKTLGS